MGYRLREFRRLATAYAAPGAIAERLNLFTARYSPADRISAGGGEEHEGEDIEVIEMKLTEALAMIGRGEIIDMKTITLLLQLQLETGASAETRP